MMPCRDTWIKDMGASDFAELSCAKCFLQLSMHDAPLDLGGFPPTKPYLLYSLPYRNVTYRADALSSQSQVCKEYLTGEECNKWKSCCEEAIKCCDMMQVQQPASTLCPATWDGMACWPATSAGSLASQTCPAYYQTVRGLWGSGMASRMCQSNATWEVSGPWDIEQSDFTACFGAEHTTNILQMALVLDFVGHTISILSLILAISIILGFRNLRRDFLVRDSLRMHLNLFIAMILVSASSMMFHAIMYDAVSNNNNAIYIDNPVWCRFFYTFSIYCRSVSFMGMFAEGLFLYRRISRMMCVNVRESTLKYFLLTWLAPLVTTLAYVLARLIGKKDEMCWIGDGMGTLELIFVVPNVATLLCNLIFLCTIEYNLCTKMRSDANDKRAKVLRHALRATLSLVPVFGLQFLFLSYRPRHWPEWEIIGAFFNSTQGLMVAILFCFSTKEVRQEVLPTCAKLMPCCKVGCIRGNQSKSKSSNSMTTHNKTRTSSRRNENPPVGNGRDELRPQDCNRKFSKGSTMTTALFSTGSVQNLPTLDDDDQGNNSERRGKSIPLAERKVTEQKSANGMVPTTDGVVQVEKGDGEGTSVSSPMLPSDGMENVALEETDLHVLQHATSSESATEELGEDRHLLGADPTCTTAYL